MEATVTFDLEIDEIDEISKEDFLALTKKFMGKLSPEEKIILLRIVLDLNQLSTVADIVSEIINLKR